FVVRVRLVRTLVSFVYDSATTEIYTLSLHDALPISTVRGSRCPPGRRRSAGTFRGRAPDGPRRRRAARRHRHRGSGPRGRRCLRDRKSTRLNSSHVSISYAVFCLKKKKRNTY